MLEKFTNNNTKVFLSKVFIVATFVIVVFAPFYTKIAFAACEASPGATEAEYCLLEPIFAEQYDTPVTMSAYLGRIYQAFFITAGLLATLMLIVGGFQYMLSENGMSKSKAREQMMNAVWGLLLALSSYLILYTINPELLNTNFKLNIPDLKIGSLSTGGVVEGGGTSTTTPGAGKPWPDDSVTRQQFTSAGISINKENCKTAGEKNCTSVYGIGSKVLPALKELKNLCKCSITITGGTEEGHASHGIGKNIIDISLSDSKLNEFITKNGKETTVSCGYPQVRKLALKTGIYTYEDSSVTLYPHWHVCY